METLTSLKRAKHPVLISNEMDFADDFDMFNSLKYDLGKLLCNDVPLSMINDSLFLYDVLAEATYTAEGD